MTNDYKAVLDNDKLTDTYNKAKKVVGVRWTHKNY